MKLHLINPRNDLSDIILERNTRWSRYRLWKPLGLLTIAGLTPPDWDISIFDENLSIPDYSMLPRPDLVGITAFTAQAYRAYRIASEYKKMNVPVIMGGIHASLCSDEALKFADSVLIGEAETMWSEVLEDAKNGSLKRIYTAPRADLSLVPPARHDLLPEGYAIGSIQTNRGCPFNCSFCCVSSFNGHVYRSRPIENVIEELKRIREKFILFVDDNLIGTNKTHIERAKQLFEEIIKAKINKKWIAQTTINFGEDPELMRLAKRSGCLGIFIGLETIKDKGLAEINKKINLNKGPILKEIIKRIHQSKIQVVGSFIMGLDCDEKGIGREIASTANKIGLDLINAFILTPFPGTKLYNTYEAEKRIILNHYPLHWKYYSLNYPVTHFKNFSPKGIMKENEDCLKYFFSYKRILIRIIRTIIHFPALSNIIANLAANLSYKRVIRLYYQRYNEFENSLKQVVTATE